MSRRSRLLDVLPFVAMPLLGSCVAPPRVVSAPPPPPPPRTVVAPPSAPAQDWADGPLTPGGWRYADARGAAFGPATGVPLFTMRCDPARRQVVLARAGAAATLAVTTTSAARAFTLADGGAWLAAGDPFLDAMVFSRGRLLVRGDALPALVLPAYAEIGRVVEDCRG